MPEAALVILILCCTLLVLTVVLLYERHRFNRLEARLKSLFLLARPGPTDGGTKDRNTTSEGGRSR